MEMEMVICPNCGEEFEEDTGYSAPDGSEEYCSRECQHDVWLWCTDCAHPMRADSGDAYCTDYGEVYCEDCYRDHFGICTSCGEEVSIDRGDYAISEGGEFFCNECYYESYDRCISCGDEIDRDYAMYTEDNGPYCEDCYPGEGIHGMHSYGYKPSPDYKKTANEKNEKPLYFGVELEVEAPDYDSIDCEHIEYSIGDDFFYCKHDGSLGECGCEVVTHPFSYEWLIDNKEDTFDNLLDYLKAHGCTSYDTTTCGMHVHLSKRAFSTLHLYKFLKMFYDPHNWDNVRLMSQRKGRKMDEWATCEDTDRHATISKAKNKYGGNRYTAVNLTNLHTVEIRIFRGTLKASSFYKNIEFLKALFDFTRDVSLQHATWENFAHYVNVHRETYTNLFNFMLLKGFIKKIGKRSREVLENILGGDDE